MAGLAILALVVGVAASFRLPLVPFGAILLGVALLGLLAGLAIMPSPSDVFAVTLLLTACTQVGYGLGLAFGGVYRARRGPAEKPPRGRRDD